MLQGEHGEREGVVGAGFAEEGTVHRRPHQRAKRARELRAHALEAPPARRDPLARLRDGSEDVRDVGNVGLLESNGEGVVRKDVVKRLAHGILDDDGDASELRGETDAPAPSRARGREAEGGRGEVLDVMFVPLDESNALRLSTCLLYTSPSPRD